MLVWLPYEADDGHCRYSPHLTAHLRDNFKPPTVVGVNILSDFFKR